MSLPLNIIFMGTPDFAVLNLQSLLDEPTFKTISVITQPDKKTGRRQILTPPSAKILATENNIPVLQPENIKNDKFIEQLKKLKPDLIVVAAFGQILPEKVLNLPKFGCINVHASLLPKYRGASPIQTAILNGDRETGITYMLMDEGLDTGDILETIQVPIAAPETGQSLFQKLARANYAKLPQVIKAWVKYEIKPQKQNNALASYTKILKRTDGYIIWPQKKAIEIERQIRAFYPWPASFGFWERKRIKILEAKLITENKNIWPAPGTVFLYKDFLCIQCQDQPIQITKLQLEGKKVASAQEIISGYPNLIGTKLT